MKTFRLVLSVAVAGAFYLAGNERLPRPEYPEPQFQRADWLSLNGAWQCLKR